MATIVAAGFGLAGAATYILGLWDWPKFESAQLLPAVGENKKKKEWFAIVATMKNKNIGEHVMRLINGTRKGIEAVSDGKDLLQEGCTAYLAGEEESSTPMPDSLCVGLFFDDPNIVDNARWAIGWAVCGTGTDSLDREKLQQLVREQVQKESGLEEEIRVVRLNGDIPILKARIPWRTMLTPMIAPKLHWKRAHQEYAKGGYKCTSDEGPVAMEVYVMRNKWFASHIDYVVAHGDNSDIWEDAFSS